MIHERAARSAERLVDAPGRRGRFATLVAKSNDDARAVGASDGIVSLRISPWNPLATLSFHQENSAIAEGLVPLRVPGLD